MDTSKTYKELSDKASPLKPDFQIERVKWYEDPIYILQCEKAEEIQKLFHPDPSNILWDYTAKYGQANYDFVKYREHIHQLVFKEHDGYEWMAIWLPRQDQLQEMVINLFPNLEGMQGSEFRMSSLQVMIHEFSLFAEDHPKLTSMEQLWLAFVMFERYQKFWSGTDWIKDSSATFRP